MPNAQKAILVIEDNAEMLENTAEILELAGYNVFKACNGKEGVVLARRHLPQLILCDIRMPELNGYGVIRALENIPEMTGIPFIFMTGKVEKADFRKGMDLGADDYLSKPFTGDDLLRIVAARIKKSLHSNERFDGQQEYVNRDMDQEKIQQDVMLLTDQKAIKKLRKKDVLFREGDSPDFLHFIVSGKIKTFKSNEFGKDYIIDIHKQGDFLSYAALLEDSKYRESAIAIENAEVALIPGQEFFRLMRTNSGVAMKFVKLLCYNFSESGDKLLKLAYDSSRKRVAEAIIFVSKRYLSDGNSGLFFALNRENISALSGISPESVSRNLSNFKEEGLIETRNRNIKIINQGKLESLKN